MSSIRRFPWIQCIKEWSDPLWNSLWPIYINQMFFGLKVFGLHRFKTMKFIARIPSNTRMKFIVIIIWLFPPNSKIYLCAMIYVDFTTSWMTKWRWFFHQRLGDGFEYTLYMFGVFVHFTKNLRPPFKNFSINLWRWNHWRPRLNPNIEIWMSRYKDQTKIKEADTTHWIWKKAGPFVYICLSCGYWSPFQSQ